jgi:hypothetical protein
MQTTSKSVRTAVNQDRQPPVSTFKTSLRDWQAKWKAQRAAQGTGATTARHQAVSA